MKSRLQAGSASAQRYKSALDGILTIIREEGVEGLYKGVGSKLMQSVLTAAILFAGQRRIYEIVKKVRLLFFNILPQPSFDVVNPSSLALRFHMVLVRDFGLTRSRLSLYWTDLVDCGNRLEYG